MTDVRGLIWFVTDKTEYLAYKREVGKVYQLDSAECTRCHGSLDSVDIEQILIDLFSDVLIFGRFHVQEG